MKKLLILMLVLGLTASANAVIITFDASAEPACGHTPGGDRDVLPGAVVVVEVTADTVCTSAYMVSVTESTTSAAGDATASSPAYHASFNLNIKPGNVRNMMTNWGAGTPRYMLLDRATASMSPAGNIAVGQVLYSFEVTIPSDAVFCDTFTITAALGTPAISPPPAGYSHSFDAGPVTTTDLVLHVIPEPATIALLGLGGLLLRRRK